MRKYIDIVEGDIVAFPGNDRPVDKTNALRGGADVHGLHQERPSLQSLDPFTKGYIYSALASGDAQSSHSLSYESLHPDAAQRMVDACQSFQDNNTLLLAKAYKVGFYSEGMAGADFWASRNGHPGFTSRGLDNVGQTLAAVARTYGKTDLRQGQDGLLHARTTR